MNVAYILTGGNIGDRHQNLLKAQRTIEEKCGNLAQASALYETEAWGLKDQPSFYNQALEINTTLSAEELLHTLLSIEYALGRVRTEKYGPRTVDIDILFFNQEIIQQPGLTIPHPQLHLRRFALACLAEIAPGYLHPVFGKTVEQLLTDCPDTLEVHKLG